MKYKKRKSKAGQFGAGGFLGRYFSEKNVFVLIMLLTLLALSAVPVYRFFFTTGLLPFGDAPYYNHRIAAYEKNSFPLMFFSDKDYLVFDGREYHAGFYHWFL